MSATVFTGPVLVGNVLQSDGTGNLAGVGGSSGQCNVGFCQMYQAQAVTQATNGGSAGVYTTAIVIPAGSQIINMQMIVTAAWSGGATTMGIGVVGTATYFTTATAVQGSTLGLVTIIPGTSLTQINNWLNTGTQDVQLMITSGNTGTGTGWLEVEYVQGLNNYTQGAYTNASYGSSNTSQA